MLKAPEGLRCKEQTEPHNTVKHRRNADSVGWTTRVNFDFVPNISHVMPENGEIYIMFERISI